MFPQEPADCPCLCGAVAGPSWLCRPEASLFFHLHVLHSAGSKVCLLGMRLACSTPSSLLISQPFRQTRGEHSRKESPRQERVGCRLGALPGASQTSSPVSASPVRTWPEREALGRSGDDKQVAGVTSQLIEENVGTGFGKKQASKPLSPQQSVITLTRSFLFS